MNPILPLNHFVPDGEARVMPDGRLYLYGSYDMCGVNEYCSRVLHVFSTDDMVNWTDHGVAFSVEQIPWARKTDYLYAPDCIHKDGKYYLYFCTNSNKEGVAVADDPWGPFTDPKPINIADGDGIDPSIFIDDDGQAYYYWGQFHLCGAKMNPDMCTLDESTLSRNLIDEKRHGFHEGSSLRNRNGIYYMIFTDFNRGRATCLGYAMSSSPLGPFEYKGIIVDNVGCDPRTWNNHGSICEFKGQWYIFYHRSSQNSMVNRRMCVEPIYFEEDGTIKEVLPTTQGSEKPLSVSREIEASRACRLGGYNMTAYAAPDPEHKGEEILCNARDNSWAVYRYVDFDREISRAELLLQSTGSGSVEIWAGDELLGKIEVEDTAGEWKHLSAPVKSVRGVYPLYLEWYMKPGQILDMKKICFCV